MVSKKQSGVWKTLFSKGTKKEAETTATKQNTKIAGIIEKALDKIDNIKHSSKVKTLTKNTETLVSTHKLYAEQVGKKCTLTPEFVMKLFKSNTNNNADKLIRYSLAVSFAVSLYQRLYLYSVQIPFIDIVKTIPLLLKDLTIPNQQNIAESDFVVMFLEYFDKDNRLVDTLVTKAIASIQKNNQNNSSKLVITCTEDNLLQYLLEEVNGVVECFMNIWLPYFDLYQRNKKSIGEIDKSFSVDFNPDGKYIKDDDRYTFDSVLEVINPPTLDIIAKDVYDKFMNEVVLENVKNHARLITPEKVKNLTKTSKWTAATAAAAAPYGGAENSPANPVQIYLVEVKDNASKNPSEATQYCNQYDKDIRKYAQQYVRDFYDSMSIQGKPCEMFVPNLRIRYFAWIDSAKNVQITDQSLFNNVVFRKHIIEMRRLAQNVEKRIINSIKTKQGDESMEKLNVETIINDFKSISEKTLNVMSTVKENRALFKPIIEDVCNAFDPKIYKELQKNDKKNFKAANNDDINVKAPKCPKVTDWISALWKSKHFIAQNPPNNLLPRLLKSGALEKIQDVVKNQGLVQQISEEIDNLINNLAKSNTMLKVPDFTKITSINLLSDLLKKYMMDELSILGKVFDVEGRSLIGVVMQLSKINGSTLANLMTTVDQTAFLNKQKDYVFLVCKDNIGPRNCIINNTYYVNFETFMFKLLVGAQAILKFLQQFKNDDAQRGGVVTGFEVLGIIILYLVVVFFISVSVGLITNNSENCLLCCFLMLLCCCFI